MELKRISGVLKVVGLLVIILGFITILMTFRHGVQWLVIGAWSAISGLVLLFLGHVGEAIDDIRENTSNNQHS